MFWVFLLIFIFGCASLRCCRAVLQPWGRGLLSGGRTAPLVTVASPVRRGLSGTRAPGLWLPELASPSMWDLPVKGSSPGLLHWPAES